MTGDKVPAVMGVREFYGGDLQGILDKLDYLAGSWGGSYVSESCYLFPHPIISMIFRIMIILILIMERL